MLSKGERSQACIKENQEDQEAIQAPRYPMFESTRGLLERRNLVCDIVGDISKKVKIEVQNFQAKGRSYSIY